MNIGKRISTAVIVCLSLLWATNAHAQTIEILGFTADGVHPAQVRAKLDTAGKTPKSVTTYAYDMSNGYNVTSTNYNIHSDNGQTYLSAQIYHPYDEGEYTYRVAVTFTDGSVTLSPVVNEDLTKAFMWLGDYNYTSAFSGWEGHSPTVDKEIDPSMTLLLDGVRYYKGVSNHAPGFLLYKFPTAPFTEFVTRIGVTDGCSEGDVAYDFYIGKDADVTEAVYLTKVASKVMYALTNASRGESPCIADINFDFTGYKVLRVNLGINDWENYGDHANMVMSRLYLPFEKTRKNEQTVTFVTAGGELTEAKELEATSTSGGTVFYRIVEGSNLATIVDGKIVPVWGSKGTVLVEAVQYGDDTYEPAASYISFNVDAQPVIEILGVYEPTIPTRDHTAYAYLYVDTKGKTLDKLNATVYDNVKNRVKTSQIELLPSYYPSKGNQIIEIELPNYEDRVVRIAYSYSDREAVDSLAYWHSEGRFDYMSDLPFTFSNGYGAFPGKDKPYPTPTTPPYPRLAIGNTGSVIEYSKGFGPHAPGWVEIAPDYLSPYYRIAVDVGAQYYSNKNNKQELTLRLQNGNTELATEENVTKDKYFFWDYPINNQAKVRIVGDPGSDNNGNDYVCFGAPRFYYSPVIKTSQAIDWENEVSVVNNKVTEIPLTAVATSGQAVRYRIVSGSEYGYISDGKLVVTELPNGGAQIIVDAYQPGDDIWAPAEVATCVFKLNHGLEIQNYEYVEISGPEVLDYLIVHIDKKSGGQLNVKNGLVSIKTLVVKYTFTPGEWSYISFPADLNIEKISNFSKLGYTYNGYHAPAYFIRELDSALHASDSDTDGWVDLQTPDVKARKGYIMSINNYLTDEPVEVTFTIDNTSVDLVEVVRSLGLTLDLSTVEPGKTQRVTVTSANDDVQSNNLTIDITFDPSDTSSLPLNHEKALEAMRFTFVNGHKAIRLTLPDQTPARVVFFDKEGKKVVKAVRYIAPNVIDLRDMKSGTYNMVVGYGPAAKTFPITL